MVKEYVLITLYLIVSPVLIGAEYGRIGVRILPDLLPNFVNLIFNDAGVSKASEVELKQAQERLEIGLGHARDFIADTYTKYSPYQSSIDRINDEIRTITDKIKNADIWGLLDEKGKYEFAKKTVLERNPHFAYYDEEKWRGNVGVEMKKLEFDFSPNIQESNRRHLQYLKKQLSDLGYKTKLDSIMMMLELSPDTVSYFYSQKAEILRKKHYWFKGKSSLNHDIYINDLERCGTIGEQAAIVARQKNDVNRFSLNIALQNDIAEWSNSQRILNLFNSVYLSGYFNYGSYSGQKSESSVYLRTDIQRHFGDIVDIFNGTGENKKGVLINTLAVLQAQSIKRVISELFKFEGISGNGRSLEYIANPSEQSIAFARRKKVEYENILKVERSDRITVAYNEYEYWALYQGLLELSLQCDNIVRKSIIENIRDEENAERLFNSKIKDILGNTVRISGAYFYNF